MTLGFNEYQASARETAIYPEAGEGTFASLSYAVLGLTNEAGEVAGKLKKIWRDQGGALDEAAREAIASELGDVFWYMAATATELGYDLSVIGEDNLNKLFSRKARGVIGGSGDNR